MIVRDQLSCITFYARLGFMGVVSALAGCAQAGDSLNVAYNGVKNAEQDFANPVVAPMQHLTIPSADIKQSFTNDNIAAGVQTWTPSDSRDPNVWTRHRGTTATNLIGGWLAKADMGGDKQARQIEVALDKTLGGEAADPVSTARDRMNPAGITRAQYTQAFKNLGEMTFVVDGKPFLVDGKPLTVVKIERVETDTQNGQYVTEYAYYRKIGEKKYDLPVMFEKGPAVTDHNNLINMHTTAIAEGTSPAVKLGLNTQFKWAPAPMAKLG